MARRSGLAGIPVGLLLAALLACGGLLVWFDRGRDEYDQYDARSQAESAARARRAVYRRAGEGLAFDLQTGAVGPGHSSGDLSSRYPPTRIDTYRQFARVVYRDGERVWIELWVRDGRVVEAWRFREATGATAAQDGRFADKFFEMSAADRAAWRAELDAAAGARREAAMAVAGPLGYTGYHDPRR